MNQEKALLTLLTTPSVEGAARTAGLSWKTIYRYLEDPDFARQLEAERGAAFDLAAGALQALLGRAVDVLAGIMDDETTPSSIRVRAANSVLNHARAWYEIDEIERRLDEVEIVLEWE